MKALSPSPTVGHSLFHGGKRPATDLGQFLVRAESGVVEAVGQDKLDLDTGPGPLRGTQTHTVHSSQAVSIAPSSGYSQPSPTPWRVLSLKSRLLLRCSVFRAPVLQLTPTSPFIRPLLLYPSPWSYFLPTLRLSIGPSTHTTARHTLLKHLPFFPTWHGQSGPEAQGCSCATSVRGLILHRTPLPCQACSSRNSPSLYCAKDRDFYAT